ncbi:Frag1/DRAM/Sfk1 family-domain-containing protein [Morchella snyderi]|nr:Frag1/DRAM/Sfk1 family-domain-containing protein [Morchella snyderi]
MPRSTNPDLCYNEEKPGKRYQGSLFSIFPLIGAAVWFSMLWSMMIIWVSQRQPRYSHMNANQRMVYISDIGSNSMKPFFIVGCSVTAAMFSVSLFSIRRNYASGGKLEMLYDIMSTLSGLAGSVGLILLSIFDLARHRTLHIIFLILFVMGIILSASSTMHEYCHVGRSYEDFEILRAISFVKIVLIGIEIILWVIDHTCMSDKGRYPSKKLSYEIACAYVFTFYMLSYFFDLKPMAITKDQAELLRVLNAKRGRTPLFGSPQMVETPVSETQ